MRKNVTKAYTEYEKWWCNYTKVFCIRWMRKYWKESGTKPHIALRDNGGRKRNGDTCFNITLTLGYLIINYTNFDLQKQGGN